VLIALFANLGLEVKEERGDGHKPATFGSSLEMLKNGYVAMMIFALFLYVGAEVSLSSGIPIYLHDRFMVDTTKIGLLGTGVFFLALTVGPVLAAFLGAVILAGPTITGYLADTNTGVHSLGADYLLHHGGSFNAIQPITTDRAMIVRFFVQASYPSGAHALFGLLGALSGASLLWVSTPMMGLCLAVAALTLSHTARRIGVGPVLAAFGGIIVSCGALTFSFGLASELKEIVTLPILIGLTACAVDPLALLRPRALIVVAAGALAGRKWLQW